MKLNLANDSVFFFVFFLSVIIILLLSLLRLSLKRKSQTNTVDFMLYALQVTVFPIILSYISDNDFCIQNFGM